jgi:enoyl-CoA hydratase/carnithine racemase
MEQRSNGQRIDTGTEDLLCRVEERAAIVTLNRPAARNALSLQLKEQLALLLARLAEDDGIGCVLLTGAGDIFSAGGDTGKMAEGDAISNQEDRVRRVRNEHRIPAMLHEMPKPTLCALPGAAAGAGLSLALACDLRIAAERAFVITSFSRLGLSGDYGGSWFLTQLVGPAKARELYFCSPRVPSEECERLGIFNRVVPDGELADEALALAKQLAAGPPIAFRFMKQNLNRALTEDLQTCLDYEADRMVRSAFTEDFREAVEAFQAKRPPDFKGR